MLITLYKSALCPRCRLAKKHILELISENPELQLREVDVLTAPRKSWKNGIRIIPAVSINGNVLSGLYLKRKALAEFIASHKNELFSTSTLSKKL